MSISISGPLYISSRIFEIDSSVLTMKPWWFSSAICICSVFQSVYHRTFCNLCNLCIHGSRGSHGTLVDIPYDTW